MSFIELKKVCKQYPGTDKKAVTDFDLEINEKEFIAFVGPSGCGKSTLLELIARLIPIETGSLLYPACNKTPAIGYMLQKDHLLEHRTIYKNIIL